MATTSAGFKEAPRRRLPKLTGPDPAAASSDETPRTATSNGSARQRRRAQQQMVREQTPNGRETLSPQELPLPPRVKQSEERPVVKRRKDRRRAKSSTTHPREPSLLQGFEDEVIIERSKKAHETILPDLLLTSSHAGAATSKSAPTSRVYFENKKTFSSVNKDTAALRLATISGGQLSGGLNENYTFQQQTAEVLKRYTVHVAKQTHAWFQRFFLFIHGINSGYALWVCILAYVFTQTYPTEFFTAYQSIALITHVLFYLFIALCIVDILDRIDPVKFNRTVLLQSISLQNSALALIFYLIAMIVNLFMMQTEDYLRMIQYSGNSNTTAPLTISNVVTTQNEPWKRLTAVRAAFIVAGWLVVSMHVKNDRLSTMIKNTEEKAFYEELRIEQNTAPIIAGTTSA